MAKRETRPTDYPKLEHYEPTRFMLPTSHYDEKKADRAVKFIEMLPHTKGEWEKKPFWLLPWQERIVRDVFGVVKEDGMRQFRTVYIEIPKKQGKQLALDTPIPTPEGFSTMGGLKVGDTVLDEKGHPCHVIAKSEVDTTEQAYRLMFQDGSFIVAGARHLWQIDGHDSPISTQEMAVLNRTITISAGHLKTHVIDSIECLGNGIPMQCIQVDNPNHLYLAGTSMVPTHNSELAAAIALYLLYADNEPSAEVFSAAADRQQASIVYEVGRRMVEMTPALKKRSKIMTAGKRIVNYSNSGYYQVVSADVGGKHGYSISGLCFDEIHNQPNRKLWDVLTKGSGDARRQALHVAITTAGTDRNSICYELHMKAMDLLNGRKVDPTFYPVVYSLPMEDDWTLEENWYKVNPSLGYTVPIERMREAFLQAQENPAEENVFRTLRLCQWVGSTVAWIPDHIYEKGNLPIDTQSLEGRDCYAGLDLSSSGDITALVLMFPPRTEDEKYICLPYFWVPEETIPLRVQRTSVPYDNWAAQGYLTATPGNVIDYAYIQNTIEELSLQYHILEIAFDRWGSNMLVERLTEMGLTVVPFGQGYKDMSAPSREFYEQLMKGNLIHGGNPILKWMCGNVVIEQDPAGNIKPTKSKSADKIDGVVAAIMALDRCIRHEDTSSVYDNPDHGLLVF